MTVIIASAAVLGALAVVFGVGLGYAGVKFEVKENEDVILITELLPGANCGGCGFLGCADLAAAIAKGEASANACPSAGDENIKRIMGITGEVCEIGEKKAAFIKCGGNDTNSKFNYRYAGLNNCAAAAQLTNGGCKSCQSGCIGGGSCVAACKFGAVSIINGLAVIDNGKCACCGVCVKSCPKNIIEMVPQKSAVRVACNTNDNGKTVRANCSAGCLGCKLCVKVCHNGAVSVDGFLARIDYEKCDNCGECAKKCPSGAIRTLAYIS